MDRDPKDTRVFAPLGPAIKVLMVWPSFPASFWSLGEVTGDHTYLGSTGRSPHLLRTTSCLARSPDPLAKSRHALCSLKLVLGIRHDHSRCPARLRSRLGRPLGNSVI